MQPSIRLRFQSVQFLHSASSSKGWGKHDLPEIAVAGRSNVGKSTLLNHLFGRKGLVKTSSTPGKTQLLNFFSVDERAVFVDLPGYGYASVPLSVRKQWGPMVQEYLDKRENLSLILFLFDIRREPNEDDIQLLDWIAFSGKQMVCVLTKADKLRSSQRKSKAQKIIDSLGLTPSRTVVYSSTENLGKRELIKQIEEHIKEGNDEGHYG